METRLIKTFAPLADESGQGYYQRLSAANGLSGWKELMRLSDLSGSRTALFNRPEVVSRMLGIDIAACQMASKREDAALGWRNLRRSGFDAVCPQCLKDSAHIRLGWDHAYMVACPIHRTLLVDKCGACGSRLSDQREHIDMCECGQHLPAMESTPATSAQLWVASHIAPLGADSDALVPALPGVHLDLFSILVRTLCQLFDPALGATRENGAAPKLMHEAIEFLKPFDQLLEDWPRGFQAHVRDRIAAGPEGGRTLNTRLGRWYFRIRQIAPEDNLNPFLDVIHQLAAKEYSGALALDHVAGGVGLTASHFMLPEAAARVGVHRETLRKAVHAGEVKARSRPYANQGLALEISFADVEALTAARKGWIGKEEARTLLNVPKAVFDNFLLAGLLVPEHSARTDIWRGEPMERAAVQELQALLMTGALREGQHDGTRLRLSEFQVRKLGDKQAIVRALKAIVEGNVRPIARAKTVGELEFFKSDIDPFFTSKALESGLSVQALSKLTGWKWESISHWIDIGLLDSVPSVLRGQPCRVVMPEHLLKFSATYVPLTTLAHSIDARSSELLERLGDIETFGGKPLRGGAVRGALVRLSDLARAALLPGIQRQTSCVTNVD